MESTNGLLKIGDFARFADTNLRTLRYYEELKLMEPAARSEGGFRYYRETDANRVHLIRDLQNLGLPLEGIADLLSKPPENESQAAFIKRVQSTLKRYDELLSDRILQLENQRKRVKTAVSKMSDCSNGCDHVPSSENNLCEPCPISGVGLPRLLSALF